MRPGRGSAPDLDEGDVVMRYLPSLAVAALLLAPSVAVTQDLPRAAQAKPAQNNAWVKLCETPASTGKDLFGKPGEVGVKTCLVQHERRDSSSGDLQVAAGVRRIGDRLVFTVMVPPDVHRPAGTRIDILPQDLWERVLRREQIKWIEIPKMRTLKLKFAFCHADGCTAETDASPELLAALKANAGFLVYAFKYAQRPSAYPIALDGFAAAYDGPATDSAKFYAARAELMRRLRERRMPRVQPKSKPQDI